MHHLKPRWEPQNIEYSEIKVRQRRVSYTSLICYPASIARSVVEQAIGEKLTEYYSLPHSVD